MTNLEKISVKDQFKNRTPTAMDLVNALLSNLPREFFAQQDSMKIKIPCWHLTSMEKESLFTSLHEFFGPDQKIGFNSIMSSADDSVNIPISLLEEMESQKASRFIEFIKPYIQKVAERTQIVKYLEINSVGALIEEVWPNKETPYYHYHISYELDALTDPLRSIRDTVNTMLEERLFGSFIKGGKSVCLTITEENVKNLIQNPNLDKLPDILCNADQRCREYLEKNGLSGFFSTFADKIIHPKPRLSPQEIYPQQKEKALAENGQPQLPSGFL